MKTNFNHTLQNKNLLLNLALKGLEDKSYKQFSKQQLKKEIDILEDIKFDGYLYIVYEMVKFAKSREIDISVFGSIQNSVISYALDIVSETMWKKEDDFLYFTPFQKKPIIYMVADSNRYYELISYIKHKYPKLIKKTKEKTIVFNDKLKIKFIDLDINKQE